MGMSKALNRVIAYIALLILALFALSPSLQLISTVKAEEKVLYVAEWYSLPAAVNWNPFASGSALLPGTRATRTLCVSPLFYVAFSAGLILGMTGTDLELFPENGTVIIKIEKGLNWFNGTHAYPFTCRDVWTYYVIQWRIFNNWVEYLEDVKCLDDYTLMFKFFTKEINYTSPAIDPNTLQIDTSKTFNYTFRVTIPYGTLLGMIVPEITTPYPIFGKYAEYVYNMDYSYWYNTFRGSTNQSNLQNEIRTLPINTPWCYGPYWYVPQSLARDGVTLIKNPYSPYRNIVKFDKIQLQFLTSSDQLNAILLEGKCAFCWHGVPPSLLVQMSPTPTGELGLLTVTREASNVDVQGIRIGVVNWPLNITAVRRAIPMFVNRTEMALAYPPYYLPFIGIIANVDETLLNSLPKWLLDLYYDYSYNPQEGYKILEQAGFRRGSDGYWYDSQGRKLQVRVDVVSAFANQVAIMQNMAEQLQRHGVDAWVNALPSGHGLDESDPVNWGLYWRAAGYVMPSLAFPSYGGFGACTTATRYASTKFNYTWPVPLKNGTIIYVNPYWEWTRMTGVLPGTPEFWDAFIKFSLWYNYYLPCYPMQKVLGFKQISVTMTNIVDFMPTPRYYTMGGYNIVFYDVGMNYVAEILTTTYFFNLVKLGIIEPGPPKVSWPPPPDYKPPDLLALLRQRGVFIMNVTEAISKLAAPTTTTTVPSPTTSPTPTTTTAPSPATSPTTTTSPTTSPTLTTSPTPTQTAATTIPIATTTVVVPTTITSITTAVEVTTTIITQTTTEWTTTAVTAAILLAIGIAAGYLTKRR